MRNVEVIKQKVLYTLPYHKYYRVIYSIGLSTSNDDVVYNLYFTLLNLVEDQ